jgi:RNA recognition motif-containing protein
MGNRLYVGNLSFDTTTASLEELFAPIGRGPTDVFVVTDRMTGRSRGFAFVTMSTDQDAAAAIEQLDGKMFEGRPLRVNEAQERPSRPGGPGGGGGGGQGGDHRGGGGGGRHRG